MDIDGAANEAAWVEGLRGRDEAMHANERSGAEARELEKMRDARAELRARVEVAEKERDLLSMSVDVQSAEILRLSSLVRELSATVEDRNAAYAAAITPPEPHSPLRTVAGKVYRKTRRLAGRAKRLVLGRR